MNSEKLFQIFFVLKNESFCCLWVREILDDDVDVVLLSMSKQFLAMINDKGKCLKNLVFKEKLKINRSINVPCSVFRPAFRCCADPKAGQNTFFCLIYIYIFVFCIVPSCTVFGNIMAVLDYFIGLKSYFVVTQFPQKQWLKGITNQSLYRYMPARLNISH